MKSLFKDKTIVVTGGTGSLGKVLSRRLLSGEHGMPRKIIVFSRDEAKQHLMRIYYQQKRIVTDEVIYRNFEQLLEFRLGDVRDYSSVCSVLKNADIVVNAAALKQVPSCEYFPFEAVRTNVGGAENIVRAIRENDLKVDAVVGVSTDKACKPVNVMGMTKALQERIFISANIAIPSTRFVCVRYGNVLASRGSVIPLFHEQIRNGGPVTVTTEEMTRFLLPLERAVETVFAALESALPGDIYVPKVPSARMINVAKALVGDLPVKIEITGIRPGEKVHEVMVSEEEAWRTFDRDGYYAIRPLLPELMKAEHGRPALNREYSSGDSLLTLEETRDLLTKHNLMVGRAPEEEEMLR
ncbi:MAG: polysaccharide biosynthesis protein [Deltaproteobacteria bacterium]|nr:polysaccharide biosynthesis protein [Deltaproteobacteria bacterium]